MTLVFCKLRPSFSLSRQRSRVRAPSSPPYIQEMQEFTALYSYPTPMDGMIRNFPTSSQPLAEMNLGSRRFEENEALIAALRPV